MNKAEKELHSTLHRCFYRYVFHRFLQDMSSIIVTMGLLALGVVVALRYIEILEIARIAYPKATITYFAVMVVITACVYAIWQVIFHRPTMREIVNKIDNEAAMQQQLLYCYESQHNRDDIALQYIAQNVHSTCDKWQHYPHTTITKSFARQAILVAIWLVALWMLFISPSTAFTNTKKIADNNATAKVKSKTQTTPKQKKQQQKKKKPQQKKQKKQQQKKNQQQQKQQKPTPQKSKKPQQKKPQKNSPQNKNQRPQGGKGKGKKNNKKNGKQLPKAKPKKEQISSLFSQGDDVDLNANVGTSNKGDLSDIEMFHRNLKQLPIYFQKQFLSPEDKMAIKRYFNMIRPSRNSKTQ